MPTVTPTNSNFSTSNVAFSDKHMSTIMGSADNGNAWAQGILDADRLPVDHAALLNERNATSVDSRGYINWRGNENTYGALRLGLKIDTKWARNPDTTVKAALTEWTETLNGLMPARDKYEVSDLPILAQNLKSAATALRASVSELSEQVEIGASAQTWNNIVDGLDSLSRNITSLHSAHLADGHPREIESVVIHLDIPAKEH